MIVFKAKEENKNSGNFGSFMKNFGAIAAGKLVNQLNEKRIEMKCDFHPNEDSVISVSINENKPQFEIDKVCCDEMRKRVERFLEHQK